jgi:hypothetical protein
MIKYHHRKLAVILILFTLAVVFVILHNLVYAILGWEEPFFFLLALLTMIVLPPYITYTLLCVLWGVLSRSK